MFNLKQHFLLDPSVTFLNHGSFGATPKPVFDEYQRWQLELERQPVEFMGRRFAGLMAESRAALEAYLGTHADNLVYTQNVTISINIVARSLELGAGDEVLTSDHEYGAIDRTWRFLAKERGFTYVNQPFFLASREAFIDSFWSAVTPRTRVIFLSHITSPTALIFPVDDIIKRARAAGIITVMLLKYYFRKMRDSHCFSSQIRADDRSSQHRQKTDFWRIYASRKIGFKSGEIF
jgi:isopenicillin-N epimerase